MYRANGEHLQWKLMSTLDSLRPKDRDRLEEGWAGTFYREFFCRVDEGLFAPLYSEEPSRPNVPVNVLLGLEVLKAGHGWSDEELIEQFTYNVAVRRALGCVELGEDQFELRTLYNFRHRVSVYAQQSGVDLIERAFEQVTDEQMAALKLRASRLRMDSTMVSGNIRLMSRLHLLVEVVQQVHRMLSELDQERYREEFAPYVQGTSGQFVYRVRSEEGRAHIRQIGDLMARWTRELESGYGQELGYGVLKRVFAEHFLTEETAVRPRTGREVPSGTLQSLSDPEATYRKKAGRSYVGYVANVTETCDPRNPVQLITKVQVEANTVDDPALMEAALPALHERMEVRELYTDGGYNSEPTATLAREMEIDHIQTALRGHTAKRLSLRDFALEGSEKNEPVAVTCLRGQRGPVGRGKGTRYAVHFPRCERCPWETQCPGEPLKRKGGRGLHFTLHDWEIARRRQRIARDPETGRKMRGPVEPTMADLKRPFRYGKLPVRGRWRVKGMLTAVAGMVNIRRIQRAQGLDKGPRETVTQVAVQVHGVVDRALLCLHRIKSFFQARNAPLLDLQPTLG